MKHQEIKTEIDNRIIKIRECINALKCSKNAIHSTANNAELFCLINVLTDSLSSAVDIAAEDLTEFFSSKMNS